jgi:NADH:ubiquinone reductase (H+-translocating)
VLIVGGGYIGVYTALELKRAVRRGEATVTVVCPDAFMLYQSFLPEAASGNIEPRHVVIPLRRILRHARVLIGRVTALDHDRRTATVEPAGGGTVELGYDHVVIGVGSISRVLPVPGLVEHAVGFGSLGEAIYLRNRVLERMDVAESTDDGTVRRRALAFVFVGAGYTGIQGLAELEDLARDACRYYRTVRREDMRWVLVEAAPRVLPEIRAELADYAVAHLRGRGIEVRLATRLDSATGGRIVLSDGERFEADTLVWTAGVRAQYLAERLGFPTAERGRLVVDRYLRLAPGAWAAGDCAAVPDLVRGGVCPPTAQHALRQARRLGRNLAADLRGKQLRPFRYRQLGTLVSLGRYKGVATVLGLRLRAFPAWFLHRTYHLLRIPTVNRKIRIMADWTLALFFRRDVVQLGTLQEPRRPFVEAAAAERESGERRATAAGS